MEDSCGIHDLQSVFRLATQHFVGEGNLEKRNAIQLLHTMYSLYDELNGFKGRYKESVRVLWRKIYESQMPDDLFTSVDAPKNLLQAMQEPLITRWWTIGSLAALAAKYLKFFKLLAQAIVNMTNSDERENTIASNLLSLASSPWIVADVHFIAVITKKWLNPHMRWYQRSDPNIGQPGYLVPHRLVRYHLMLADLEDIVGGWKNLEAFKDFRAVLSSLDDTLRPMKEAMVSSFVSLMMQQVIKHNQRYLLTPKLIRAVFAEKETGQLVASLFSTIDPHPTGTFNSIVHGVEIDLPRFSKWMLASITAEQLLAIEEHPIFAHFSSDIESIGDGTDIWDRSSEDELAPSIRKSFLRELAAHPSTQHANEMFVKLGAMFGRNKSEIWAGIFAAASNGFLLLGQEENDTDKDKEVENPAESLNEDILEEPNESEIVEDEMERRKRYFRVNKKRLFRIEVVAQEKGRQIASLAVALGPEEFVRRKENIKQQLTSKEENLKAQQAQGKVSEMLSKLNRNKTNVAMNKRGEDIPPRLLGYFPYNHLRKRVNVNELAKELTCRSVENWAPSDGPTKGLKLLKAAEKKRFEDTVETALTDRGKPFVGLSLTEKLTRLKEVMQTKEESTNGEFDVDIGKFFKRQATNLDVTIFE
jgi:hypothetical protein